MSSSTLFREPRLPTLLTLLALLGLSAPTAAQDRGAARTDEAARLLPDALEERVDLSAEQERRIRGLTSRYLERFGQDLRRLSEMEERDGRLPSRSRINDRVWRNLGFRHGRVELARALARYRRQVRRVLTAEQYARLAGFGLEEGVSGRADRSVRGRRAGASRASRDRAHRRARRFGHRRRHGHRPIRRHHHRHHHHFESHVLLDLGSIHVLFHLPLGRHGLFGGHHRSIEIGRHGHFFGHDHHRFHRHDREGRRRARGVLPSRGGGMPLERVGERVRGRDGHRTGARVVTGSDGGG